MTKPRIIFTIVMFLAFACKTYSQGSVSMIEKGFSSGDEYVVGKNMAERVFYVIYPTRKMLPKDGAVKMLGEFFAEKQARNFSVVHDSRQDNVRYIIGTLTTAKGEYRIHLLLNVSDTKEEITQIRIESL